MSDEDGKPDAIELERELARSRKRVAKALKAIDKQQRHAPACHLCGQRCIRLDRAGLCSKTSTGHVVARREHDARVRARRG